MKETIMLGMGLERVGMMGDGGGGGDICDNDDRQKVIDRPDKANMGPVSPLIISNYAVFYTMFNPQNKEEEIGKEY